VTDQAGVIDDDFDAADCQQVNPNTVTCAIAPNANNSSPITRYNVGLGEGVDSFTNENFFANESDVDGFGEGSKTINAGPGSQFLGGGQGNDILNGGEGDDRLRDGNTCCFALLRGNGGGAIGPNGNDVLDGGPGRDETSYSRLAPVTITLDGVANDGETGEADNVIVEDVFTGDGNDTIIGDDGPNALGGGEGSDRVVGNGGDDELFGDFGANVFLQDSINRAGRKGGPISSPGDDTLDGGAGRDGLDCGRGIDVALREPGDAVHVNCERIGAEIADDNSRVKGISKGSQVKPKKRGKFKVRLECDPDEGTGCVGKLKVESDGKKIGKGRFNVTAGEAENGKAKLNKRGLKKLRGAGGSLLVTVTATTSEPGGFAKDRDRIQLHR
jgi:Ca2+-binding RTX toxin-like protein